MFYLQLEDTSSFPDAITTLVGQTFMFGVYIEKDSSAGAGVCYKVGKVWKDLRMLMLGENSESYSVPNQGNEVWLIQLCLFQLNDLYCSYILFYSPVTIFICRKHLCLLSLNVMKVFQPLLPNEKKPLMNIQN